MDTEKILYLFTSIASSVINALSVKPKSVDSILVIKLDEIGDMIYTFHCIEALAKEYPKAVISVYCKSMNNALIEQTGVVKNIINEPSKLEAKYDVQIDFRGNWQTLKRAVLGKCSMYFDRGSIRLRNKFDGGQIHELYTNQDTIKDLLPHGYTWKKPILKPTETEITNVDRILKEHDLKNYVVMHCGAREETRRWPAERFAELISMFYQTYDLKTVLIGAPNEVELVESVCALSQHAYSFAGKTNLMELAVIMRKSKLFVGNESGPLHFAIIEQKPLVALFGPGVKDVFYPLYPNQQVIHHVNETSTPEEKKNSIMKITVAEVFESIQTLNF